MSTVAGQDREVRTFSPPGELRAVRSADGKGITLHGYAAVYDTRSAPIYGMFFEVVKRGAFANALAGKDDVRALFDHDASMVLGRTRSKTLRLSDDAKGLKVEIDLPDTQVARDLATSIERGDISQMSFGFRKIKDSWSEEKSPEGITVDIRELLEVELFDVSPVTYPAYEQTEIAVRSRQAWKATPKRDQASRRLRLLELEAST